MIIIHAISIFSTLIYYGGIDIDFGKALGSATVVSALIVSWLRMRGMYQPTELTVLRNQIRWVCTTWIVVFGFLVVVVAELNIAHEFSGAALIFAVTGLGSLIAQRIFIKKFIQKALKGRRFAGGNIVVITDQSHSEQAGLLQALRARGFHVQAVFRLPPSGAPHGLRKRLCARVVENVRGCDNIEAIVVEADAGRWPEMQAFATELRIVPFPVVLVPVGTISRMLRRPTRDLCGAFSIEIQRGPLGLLERMAKRIVDIVGAAVILFLLSPLLLLTAAAIKLDSSGPIIFRQRRCGFNGRNFSICKFRTMTVLEDGSSIIQAQPTDSRVTRVGKWLRRMSIDELPQLFNVLEGSMSLVGPRPHAIAHDNEFDKIVRNYASRQRVKPGLTGWAQIHGCRGPTPTSASIERRVEYDLWYIDNWSLRRDIAILLQTPQEILRGRNAF
ncbi:exopolysaccharide biosynthesis polyprenyl glycosylphosphotransferase [Methylovirgula sp. 4M-Z18]|uniref:exopolysaccharide biosynthesis polyprenyl glycosylphosphotransferase n=1 Tax=Methylovirgula sp. 4M-Z18 TaxID=2293567 RepID=UPI001FDEE621|nr:exopolysaccharide biosynthesis polyprenyl glycosylphosphotransferase [Methylovirgula sp. 4M-Z18]